MYIYVYECICIHRHVKRTPSFICFRPMKTTRRRRRRMHVFIFVFVCMYMYIYLNECICIHIHVRSCFLLQTDEDDEDDDDEEEEEEEEECPAGCEEALYEKVTVLYIYTTYTHISYI